MPSLNFPPNQINIPDLDILASQAENFLNNHPDISIFRVRQLLELLVHECAKRKNISLAWDASLKDNIDFLCENKSITKNQKKQWQNLRNNINKACHYNATTTNMETWKRQAPNLLLQMAQHWAKFCNTTPPKTLTIANRSSNQQHIDNINAQLSEIENIIDYNHERMEHADKCLHDVINNQLPKLKISQKEKDWLRLRIASIQFAISNHKGLSYQTINETLIRRILEYGDPTMMAELTHYHNRAAVRSLILMDMDSTLSTLTPWLEMEESQKEYLPAKYAQYSVYQWNRAALLGTKGQALCIRGFCNRNTDDIKEGLSLFREAKDIFRKPIDKLRQDNYIMHALLDLYRLNEELPEDVTNTMQQFVSSLSKFDIENNRISVYDLGLALKIIHVLNLEMPFNREMQSWCAAQNWEKHNFPHENILGHYLSIRGKNAINENTLIQTLTNIANTDNIRGIIASVHRCHILKTPLSIPYLQYTPPLIQKWWEAQAQHADPLMRLPFYYF